MSTRPVRRIAVTAPYGQLIHEIRLSVKEGRWQARVVTLPNHIWVEPGARRALVFEAASPDEAEEMAAQFVQRDCVARGHRLADPVAADASFAGSQPARRRLARYPVRFIVRGARGVKESYKARTATTQNLSETGLFIVTDDLLPAGTRIEIDLRLPGLAERLTGVVVWARQEAARGCEVGMGVRLVDPSLAYRSLIQTLG